MVSIATWGLGMAMLALTAGRAEWTNDYGAALKAAKAEGKPLLVVIENPADRAVRFEEVSLTVQQSTNELLSKYKLCRVDVTTPYGQAVAKAFRASLVPTTVIIDKTASVQIFSKSGRFTGDQFRSTLAKYQAGKRPIIEAPREAVFCST